MIVVAENINIMSKVIGKAMRERDPGPIQEMAKKLHANGADYLDINIGPARKGGPEMMEFVVKTVQAVASLPLYLDTMNVESIEAGLKAHDNKHGRPVINSIMARPERMDALLPIAKKYDADFVALLYGPEGLPRDENERGELAATLQYRAMEAGIAESCLWYDPVVVPVTSQQLQLQGCTTFMGMLPDIAPTAKNTCGLSNVSNCAPEEKRPILNQTYLCILRNAGLKAAILDGLDEEILAFARDKRKDLEDVVARVVRGETVDAAGLSKRQADFAKTTKVLLGHTIYSDSWLEI